jgi:Icc-related predicted phosphoesterase
MKLQIFSDLHVEFEQFIPPATDADVIVLAGDIHVGIKGLNWARENFADKPVIYVLGNHEYYNQAYPRHVEKLKLLAKHTNIRILENDIFIINDIVILGCTLWTDFELFGNGKIAGSYATQTMNDYNKIRVSPNYRKLRSLDTAAIHRKSLRWMKGELENYPDRKMIVVTHHAPSQRSLPEFDKNNIISAAYASHLDDLIARTNVELWVHGHIHQQQDYQIGNTRVVCNPRGYPEEPNEGFIPDFVVSI